MTGSFSMTEQFKALISLHIIVLIWAGSGIVGDLIDMPSQSIAMYRMGLGAVALGVYCAARGVFQMQLIRQSLKLSIAMGICLAAHWWAFFESIRLATVSLGLVCLSCGPFFTAFLQPLLLGKRFVVGELVLGLCCLTGIATIFGFEPQYGLGLAIGLVASVTEVIHSVVTSKIVKDTPASLVTFQQMAAGSLALFLFEWITEPDFAWLAVHSTENVIGLVFLGVLCSAFAMGVYLHSLRILTPFTAILSVNMEPVYGIFLALLIYGERERMSGGFYLGASIIVGCVFADALLKRRRAHIRQ